MQLSADVFVVGGGPAGLAAAISAQQRGLRVIVADGAMPPVDKACGEGLMPDAVASLRELGVVIHPSESVPFCGIRFIDDRTSIHATFPHGEAIGVRRPVLHRHMHERAAALGVSFLWGTAVAGFHGNTVSLAGGQKISARWIVGADGSKSRVSAWAALDKPHSREARFAYRHHYGIRPWSDAVEIYWQRDAQAYVTPVAAQEVCVVIVARDKAVRQRWPLEKFPALHAKLSGASVLSRRGAITGMHRLPRVYRDNVALIGDASGGVDAITGEGLCLAFRQSQALAAALVAQDLRQYQLAHRRLARRPAFMASLMLLLDGRPGLRHRTFKTLAAHPELFARLASAHVGATSPAHFAATGAMLGWHLLTA